MKMCGMGGDECEWVISKPDIVSDFKFRSKCIFGAELRKEPIERAKRSQT